jgi:hypothetical protein
MWNVDPGSDFRVKNHFSHDFTTRHHVTLRLSKFRASVDVVMSVADMTSTIISCCGGFNLAHQIRA